ncbi:MAG: hypothetical protein ABIK81_03285, partial [candidate division WOR-3 bacterium]
MERINNQYLEALSRYCHLLVTRYLKFWSKSFGYPVQIEMPRRGAFNLLESEPLFPELEIQIKKVEQKIAEIKEKAKEKGIIIPLEKICAEYQLTKDEWTILSFLFINRFGDKLIKGLTLLQVISLNENPLNKIELLSQRGKLRQAGLIKLVGDHRFANERNMFFEESFSLNEEIFYQIAGVENWRELEDLEKERPKESLLIIREPEISFNHLVL